jgi:hypothetical protein
MDGGRNRRTIEAGSATMATTITAKTTTRISGLMSEERSGGSSRAERLPFADREPLAD